jgi:hypothetical protein
LPSYKLEDSARFVAGVHVVSENETGAEENRVNFRGVQFGGREVAPSSHNFFPGSRRRIRHSLTLAAGRQRAC